MVCLCSYEIIGNLQIIIFWSISTLYHYSVRCIDFNAQSNCSYSGSGSKFYSEWCNLKSEIIAEAYCHMSNIKIRGKLQSSLYLSLISSQVKFETICYSLYNCLGASLIVPLTAQSSYSVVILQLCELRGLVLSMVFCGKFGLKELLKSSKIS